MCVIIFLLATGVKTVELQAEVIQVFNDNGVHAPMNICQWAIVLLKEAKHLFYDPNFVRLLKEADVSFVEFTPTLKYSSRTAGILLEHEFTRQIFKCFRTPWVLTMANSPSGQTVQKWVDVLNAINRKIQDITGIDPKYFVTEYRFDTQLYPMPREIRQLLDPDIESIVDIELKFADAVSKFSPPAKAGPIARYQSPTSTKSPLRRNFY